MLSTSLMSTLQPVMSNALLVSLLILVLCKLTAPAHHVSNIALDLETGCSNIGHGCTALYRHNLVWIWHHKFRTGALVWRSFCSCCIARRCGHVVLALTSIEKTSSLVVDIKFLHTGNFVTTNIRNPAPGSRQRRHRIFSRFVRSYCLVSATYMMLSETCMMQANRWDLGMTTAKNYFWGRPQLLQLITVAGHVHSAVRHHRLRGPPHSL